MPSSFTTNFGFEEIVTGEQSGTWGTTSNFNYDILDRITSYKAVALSDASTATLTVREASPGEATENLQDGMFRVVKFTGSLAQTCTITIAPNTTTAWFIFENATTDTGSSGPYSLIFTQGSGADITLQNGKNTIVYCDGAGSGAIVYDAVANLQLSTLDASGDITAANFQPDGDTAAADSAAVGYTSAEGLILTGQGSTNDVTIKNDADGTVISIPTGTTNVTIAGDLTISGDDLTMGTNTSGAALIADGTNFNPVVISGDISINTSGVAAIGSGVIVTADIADDAVTTAKIVDDAVTTAKIVDDAVTLAKMATGVDGVIITYDASGNATHVGPGSDGEVLTSTGAGSPPAFEAVGGGGKILQVVSAFDNDYHSYSNTNVDAPVALSGMSIDITPSSSSSKILLIGHATMGCTNSATQYTSFFFKRDSTQIAVGDASSWDSGVGPVFVTDASKNWTKTATSMGAYIDSPFH